MAHVSASQISTWLDCQRKWWYTRHRPRHEDPLAQFGSRSHEILAAWLKHGTPPDPSTPEGACVLPGLPLLPLPGTGVVEQPFRFALDGVEYVGTPDLVFGYVPGEQITILDHKTTGNLAYQKIPGHPNPEFDLLTDPQRIMYSFWGAREYGVPWANAVWLYYRRKPPKAEPSVLGESLNTITERFAALHEIGRAMQHDYAPENLPRSLSACSKYRGCPFRAECHHDLDPLTLAAEALKGTP